VQCWLAEILTLRLALGWLFFTLPMEPAYVQIGKAESFQPDPPPQWRHTVGVHLSGWNGETF
jgi:hypothetical protein